MKKFRFKINLAAIAFMIGIGAAVAAKGLSTDTAWFYLNSTGQPVERIQGQPDCQTGNEDCAQMFNVDAQGQPTTPIGQATKGALHN